MVGYNVILFINYSSIQCRKTCFLGLWMQMRATMLPLKASTTSKDGTRLGEKHMMTYILWLGHIHIFFCGHGCDSDDVFLCVHLSLYWKPFTYLWETNHLHIQKNHDPFEVERLHYSWENIKQTLYTQQAKTNNLYSKRIHKWIIIIGVGWGGVGGRWVFP